MGFNPSPQVTGLWCSSTKRHGSSVVFLVFNPHETATSRRAQWLGQLTPTHNPVKKLLKSLSLSVCQNRTRQVLI